MPPTEQADLLLRGPWTHRGLTANGVRLHVAEAGRGPLVVLLHGFPQFWWTWRTVIPRLADAGFRVAAVDLRGFGSSDKPPRSYDLATAARDIVGLIRALGAQSAYVVGHDIGGLIAWTAAALGPGLIDGLAAISAPHPRRLRRELVTSRGQLHGVRHAFAYQLPRVPEARLVRDGGAEVERLHREWSGSAWPSTPDFAAAMPIYRHAICVPQAAYGASEYFRWMVRSLIRPDGARYVRAMRARIEAPVLHVHGGADPYLLPQSSEGSSAYVAGPYSWHVLPEIGHFPTEEAPQLVGDLLLDWLPNPR
ncbi:alpha/beta fold hydrolase [Epidermidibacterium keratini]|uniref:Alpha/beta fold hydrolase n=1 Tax=Epidermidibacterium keratini TaxID=1891644 RepID=A0A7L4YMK3_9ACTN|nr:alpha/beta hydrolase [Epidermidibacterium keratini]QHC00113.1 alpha/beta fold hydrolase [Epidermidibacterium keratini]